MVRPTDIVLGVKMRMHDDYKANVVACRKMEEWQMSLDGSLDLDFITWLQFGDWTSSRALAKLVGRRMQHFGVDM